MFFRILQGVGGGAMQPIAQAILVESFPPHKRGMAMAVYGMGVVVAPIVGPTLGGWITDNYSWRWIFFINIPVGHAVAVADQPVGRRPAVPRAAGASGAVKIDYIGLGLLGWGWAALQIVLDKGQREDWFASQLHRRAGGRRRRLPGRC